MLGLETSLCSFGPTDTHPVQTKTSSSTNDIPKPLQKPCSGALRAPTNQEFAGKPRRSQTAATTKNDFCRGLIPFILKRRQFPVFRSAGMTTGCFISIFIVLLSFSFHHDDGRPDIRGLRPRLAGIEVNRPAQKFNTKARRGGAATKCRRQRQFYPVREAKIVRCISASICHRPRMRFRFHGQPAR